LDRLSAQIKGVKSHTVSNDGATISVVLDAKYVGELALLLSVEGLNDLLSVLAQAKTEIEARAGTKAGTKVEAKATNGASLARPDHAATQAVAPKASAAQTEQPNQVTISVPKNWLVSSDTKEHHVVLVVFNHKMDGQAGYALDPNAAKKMAVGLVKNADAVLTSKTNRNRVELSVGRKQ
jgi:hypothetical protein